eukprot:436093_1
MTRKLSNTDKKSKRKNKINKKKRINKTQTLEPKHKRQKTNETYDNNQLALKKRIKKKQKKSMKKRNKYKNNNKNNNHKDPNWFTLDSQRTRPLYHRDAKTD